MLKPLYNIIALMESFVIVSYFDPDFAILSLSTCFTSAIMWDIQQRFWIMRDIHISHATATLAMVVDLGRSPGCGV
jgi:hypothetical protein